MRLDRALVARGLVTSRTRAQELIAAGAVEVDGVAVVKASLDVADDARVEVTADDGYVSRAAHKLIGALDACPELDVDGRTCLDVGASTGGFTQVLLERGAALVHAIDVGHGQLAPRIADDARVIAREGLNARELVAADLTGPPPDLVVADVSFISLTLLLTPIVGVLADDADLLLMVKPQFEVGKDRLGRGGVVTDPGDRARAVMSVASAMMSAGLAVHRIARSTLPGPHGNVEFFVWASRAWQAGDDARHRPAPLTEAQVRAAIEDETGGTP
ncbi:TlyA family RNA methyltransferase [Demequina mangrovi]|uniref:23S rRNA (Cytidine1920-2'-O)/16S rRNA (Cytidine1409-2'-O)-methyltransferase n=1 Tax=Demequina mangrovi TaxID=1043493 RepID=A0A1H7B793_9MICO|nr:TlyA family RNA methyltransferase [Demequina mangrovi]SEJ70150.1 23S rRNA (cytidine1920-2'-O)/16S rRNA (cytidine1409-2'-O)-methyltransferase [Demequina mangrovi]